MIFDYGPMMVLILSGGDTPGSGVNLAEIRRALDAIEPIEEAVAAGTDEVILSDTQWATLLEKLEPFKFGFAHRAIADFGLMIQHAPELGTEEKPRLVS
jgi:hypothetical protein